MSHSLPTKTDKHNLFDPFVGTFRAEVTVWFGPDQSHTSTGTMVNTFVLDGLYLKQEYQGDAPEDPNMGPAFAGQGYWGYNTTSELFEGFWIDIASTTMQLQTGEVDEAGKVWNMRSTFQMPGQENALERLSVITLVDDNNHTMEGYVSTGSGEMFKNMEIRYQRSPE